MPIAVDDNAGVGSHNHAGADINSGTVATARLEGDVLTASSTDTLTNKTIDANGTGNVISNIGDAEIESHTSTKIVGLPAQTSDLDMGGNDIDNIQRGIEDLSTSGTDIDFSEDQLQTISISANTTFTGANYGIGRSKTLYITTDGTLRTLAFPAGWIFQGTKPTDQAASKVGVLTLTCTTAAEAGVRCAYAVEA